jgi:endoglucanase
VFAGATFYDSPDTQADGVVAGLRQSRPADAETLERISETATGFWVGDWYGTGQVRSVVANYVSAARTAGEVPVIVVYAIPVRDCGGYSAGGIGSPAGYRAWLAEVAAGLGGATSAVVLEPDAIAGIDCLDESEAQTRYSLLREAGAALTAAGATVYLDAGHSSWLSPAEAAARLRQAGVATVRGFALNTSNYRTTPESLSYGTQVSALLGGAGFVVDTSRNGLGPAPDNAWCNPGGRALGVHPTTATGNQYADALLWLKAPGESDGTCNGGPPAGQFWVDYALGLASRAAR